MSSFKKVKEGELNDLIYILLNKQTLTDHQYAALIDLMQKLSKLEDA